MEQDICKITDYKKTKQKSPAKTHKKTSKRQKTSKTLNWGEIQVQLEHEQASLKLQSSTLKKNHLRTIKPSMTSTHSDLTCSRVNYTQESPESMVTETVFLF